MTNEVCVMLVSSRGGGAALVPIKPTSRECEYTSLLLTAAPYTHISEKYTKRRKPGPARSICILPGQLIADFAVCVAL